MTPLLGLVMIVKNEARGIAETLASVAPFIDHWTVLDTGSTDGTQDLVRQLAGASGNLHEEPFVDFATSRNRVLDLHGNATQFVLMLSGDDILVNGGALRVALAEHAAAPAEVYNLERSIGSDRFMTAIVIRTGTSWRYVGRTHEVLSKPGCFATEGIPGVGVYRTVDGSLATKRARWELDLGLLAEDLVRDPLNARAAFYLAQTYECLERYPDALDAYQRRIDVPGWRDETYEAMYRRARVMKALNRPWPDVQQAYLDAHAFDPTRAEPLFVIAQHWYDQRAYSLCYLFASRAATMPYPKTALFVDAAVYEWKAADLVAISGFHLGRRLDDAHVLAVGKDAAARALFARPDDERLQQNLRFYVFPTPDA